MRVHASDDEITLSEEDYPLKASEMRDLRHPVKSVFQNQPHLNETVLINESLRKRFITITVDQKVCFNNKRSTQIDRNGLSFLFLCFWF